MNEDDTIRASAQERALLGGLVVGGNGAVGEVLTVTKPADMFHSANRLVFATIVRLHDEGKPPDLAILRDELAAHGQLDEVGGPTGLAALVDGNRVGHNLLFYARAVKDAAVRRARQEALHDELANLTPQEETLAGELGELRATDMTNAQRLVARHGRDLRNLYTERGPGSWLAWQGGRWARDADGEVVVRAKETLRAAYAEVPNCKEKEHKIRFMRALLASERQNRLAGMISLAASEKGVPVRETELDADPWLLGVPNGVVDLRTGTLRAATRSDLITKHAGCAYDENAECPRWKSFLSEVLGENAALVAFMRRVVGYALTGNTTEQALFLFYGSGSNGKSTLLGVLQKLLGDYGKEAPPGVFLYRESDERRVALGALRGARLVATVETDEGRWLAEALIKTLTGGDRVSTRRLYCADYEEWVPTFKLILVTNHRPIIRDTTHAMWRRLRLVPFTVTIPPEKQDPLLPEKLLAELPGVLRWAIEGCLQWQMLRLAPPTEVVVATNKYQKEQDTIGSFVEDCCVVGDEEWERKAELYKAYREWAEKVQGEKPMSNRSFVDRLLERGFREERTATTRTWRGLRQARPEQGRLG